jgi:hypothetical protein
MWIHLLKRQSVRVQMSVFYVELHFFGYMPNMYKDRLSGRSSFCLGDPPIEHFCSFVESRTKIMMMMMGHECKMGAF